MNKNTKTERNRSITISRKEIQEYSKRLVYLNAPVTISKIKNKTINQSIFEAADFLPKKFADLVILDPPYNLDKSFNTTSFKKLGIKEYSDWIEKIIQKVLPTLKPTASIYFCSDWFTSTSVYPVLNKYFNVRNRITWERDKGRGSKINWKQNAEDIWFCTLGKEYTFNVEEVKLKRKVIAPYKHKNGEPKDWDNSNGNFRVTYPSNIWTDISIPFWSMPENTEHPTQKPEKLIAKLILANTNDGDLVFDPFLGSGTTSVVAKKLGRKYCGIELDKKYSTIAELRLAQAKKGSKIQGYTNGVFWERNTFSMQYKNGNKN